MWGLNEEEVRRVLAVRIKVARWIAGMGRSDGTGLGVQIGGWEIGFGLCGRDIQDGRYEENVETMYEDFQQ